MGIKFDLCFDRIFFSSIAPFFLNIKKQMKDETEFNAKTLTKKLMDFLMSDEHFFRYFLIQGFEENRRKNIIEFLEKEFGVFFMIFEYFEKYSSIKCLFPIIDEIKKSLENQIDVIKEMINNKEKSELCVKKYSENLVSFFQNIGFYEQNSDFIELKNFIKKESVNNNKYYEWLSEMVIYLINDTIYGKHENLFRDSNIKKLKTIFKKDELKKIVDDLLTFEYPLKYTNLYKMLFIFLFSIIVSEIKYNGEFNIREDLNKISESVMSDTFIKYLIKRKEPILYFIISIIISFECFLKNSSIKYLFPLIEELKKLKFDSRVSDLINKLNEETMKMSSYFNQLSQIEEKLKEELEPTINKINNNSIFNKEEKYKENVRNASLYIYFFHFFFDFRVIGGTKYNKEDLMYKFFENIKLYDSYFKDELKDIKKFLNYFIKLDYPLYYTKEIYRLFICALNIILSIEKMKNKLDDNSIKEIKKAILQNNISENKIYFVYNKTNISYYVKKEEKDEANSIYFYEIIEKNGSKIYKNLFNDEEISEDKFNNLKNDNDDNTINENQIIEENKNEINLKELKKTEANEDKTKFERDKEIELNKNEKLMYVMFTNSKNDFHYELTCKSTDKFSKLEAKFYEKFPEYRKCSNYFMINGNRIINHKTLEENHFKDSNVVIIYKNND